MSRGLSSVPFRQTKKVNICPNSTDTLQPHTKWNGTLNATRLSCTTKRNSWFMNHWPQSHAHFIAERVKTACALYHIGERLHIENAHSQQKKFFSMFDASIHIKTLCGNFWPHGMMRRPVLTAQWVASAVLRCIDPTNEGGRCRRLWQRIEHVSTEGKHFALSLRFAKEWIHCPIVYFAYSHSRFPWCIELV